MPYSVKKNKFKYRNPTTGNYEGVDVVAEQSFEDYRAELEAVGDSQETRVTDAGTAQVNAVTAAGTAAVANFPATADACDTLAADFAATFVPNQAYAAGDYCTYQYKLYQSKAAIAENADSSFVVAHWNLITVTDSLTNQVDDLKNALGNSIAVGTLTDNRYINKNTGAVSGQSSGSKATENFIAIPSGAKLLLKNVRNDGARGVCFYSEESESSFLSAASLEDSAVIESAIISVPVGANYIRVTGHMNAPDPTISVVDILVYAEGKLSANLGAANAGKTLKVDPSGEIIAVPSLEVDNTLTQPGDAADAKVTGDKITEIVNTIIKAPVNVGSVTDNAYVNKNTGVEMSPSSGSNVTGFIKVYPLSVLKLEKIRTDGARGTCFYSDQSADSFVGSADFSDVTSGTVTVPANANYMRVTGAISTGTPVVTVIDISGYIDNINSASKARAAAIDAVTDDLQDQIDEAIIKTEKSICTISDFTEHGYLNDDGSFTEVTSDVSTQWTTGYIEISDIVYYTLERSSMRKVCAYDANKSFLAVIAASQWNIFRLVNINNGTGAKYLRLNTNDSSLSPYCYLYAVKTGKGIQETLNHDISVPIKLEPVIPYARMRRPLVAFILDGEYDENDDMHDVFAAHHVFCGFAPQYSTEFANNSLSTYLEWQAEGFEILSHGAADLSPETSLTDEQAKASIDRSYNWMIANGLDVKGYIGLAGSVQPKLIPHIAKYFDWAATTWNHAATGATYTEPCMFYGVDRPYYAWRYSMQRSDLAAQKAAVDRALANDGLVLFYGHARSDETDYFTTENLDTLLTYIETVGATVVRPTEAVQEYFAVRYDDLYNILHA